MSQVSLQMRLASEAMFVGAVAVYGYCFFVYNVVILGRVMARLHDDALCVLLPLRVVFNTVWLLASWSFLRARYSDPGRLPEAWREFVLESGPKLPIAPARREWQPRKATMCLRCNFPRPERAHHCAMCNRCILRYDHHCPWINNCVGFLNHKFFLLTSVYGWLLGIVVLATLLPLMPQCIRSAVLWLRTNNLSRLDLIEDSFADAVVIITLGVLAMSSCMMLSSVLRIHLPLSFRNTTSVEDFYDNMANPFEQGGLLKNLAQIFGVKGPDWAVPIRPLQPISDGVAFRYWNEVSNQDSSEGCQSVLDCLLEGDWDGDSVSELGEAPRTGKQSYQEEWAKHYGVRNRHLPQGLLQPGDAQLSLDSCQGDLRHEVTSQDFLSKLWNSFTLQRNGGMKRAVWV